MAQDALMVAVDRYFDPDEVEQMVAWLFKYRVQLVRFNNGMVGRPEDLLLGGVRTRMHIAARFYFEDDEDAILFKLKFA